MAEKYCNKPRLAEVLGVEVNERFKVEGFINVYFVDEYGNFWRGYGRHGRESVAGPLNYAINFPERIIHLPKLAQQRDVEDAKAVRRIFPEVTHIVKLGGTVNFGYFPNKEICEDEDGNEAVKDAEAVTMGIPETSRLFPSANVGERIKLDDILGQEDKA